jgi:hypothetical protein
MIPFTSTADKLERSVGMSALVLHMLVAGSYASTVCIIVPPLFPPMAYTIPFTAAAANTYRAVGRAALVLHMLVAGSYASLEASRLKPPTKL